MNLYAENILDHARHPRHKQHLEGADIERREVNTSCGDQLTLQLRLSDGRVTEVGWEGEGCAISQASMSLLSEELLGKNENEMEKIAAKDIFALLGVDVGPRRIKCALLPLHTLKNALHVKRKEPEQPWRETLETAGTA